MQIPSDLSLVQSTSSSILASLKSLRLDDSIIFDIKISLEEALINAIKHGNKENIELPVNVNTSICDNYLEIVVEDKGTGFDYTSLMDSIEDKHLEKTSGRGVFLIRKLMDKVTFEDSGRRIRMRKYLK